METVKRDQSFVKKYGTGGTEGNTHGNEGTQFAKRNTEGRLHKYLKELRKGHFSSTKDEVIKERHSYAYGASQNTVDTSMEDSWNRMMRLRGTVADSRFTEHNAGLMNYGKETYNDVTSRQFRYSKGYDDVPRNGDLHDPEFDGLYASPHSSHLPSEDTPVSESDYIEHLDVLDHISLLSFGAEEGSGEMDPVYPKFRQSSSTEYDLKPERIKTHLHEKGSKPYEDVSYDGSETGYRYMKYYEMRPDESEYRDLAMSLRGIANQIESISNGKGLQVIQSEEKCRALSRKLISQQEELTELRRRLSAAEKLKHEMAAKISDLECKVKNATHRRYSGDVSFSEIRKDAENCSSSETLPPFEIESCKLGSKAKSYIKMLKSDLYVGLYHSLTISFQTELYRTLHEMPDVVHCRELVSYINDGIIGDAEVLHARLRQSALKYGVVRTFLEEHQSPFSNRYPFPAEFEQRIVAEVEASHPLRRFSMELPPKYDNKRDKSGIVMSRVVLRAIFKYSHINNLYNYLFTACYWDNFRVVDILKDAIGLKFLDFQMLPMYKDKVRHPLMLAFGDSNNATQAYRYMRALDFDFVKFPVDPNDGENLWHRIVKGDAVKVVQSLKPFVMYNEYLYQSDQQGRTPLDLAKGRMLKEMLTLMVVDVASKGSEMYKKNNFEEALKYYSEALEKQLEALGIDQESSSNIHDVNLGKLYYNKARSLLHLNRWTETVEACELCLKHIPSYTNAYVTCIQAYEKLLDWESAAKMCSLMSDNCGVVDDEKMKTLKSQLGATMFQILGLPNSATPKEIKQAFNQLCKQWHPDKVGTESSQSDLKRRSMNQFNRIYDAREKLLDDALRELEKRRPETQYKVPEPTTQSVARLNDDENHETFMEETQQSHSSKAKDGSTNETNTDEHMLQTAVDRLQHQIDEMNAIT